MTHSELYNRFQSIQASKNTLRSEMLNYIKCTLKSNDNIINSLQESVIMDSVDTDFPFIVNVADKRMNLLGISLHQDNEIRVKVYDAKTAKIHSLLLETDNMDNLETAAAFVNHTLIEIGEKNLYTLLVIFTCKNSHKLFPNTLKAVDDAEAWAMLRALKSHEMMVFQMNGPKQKFMGFDQFIEQMNEEGFSGYYAIQLHLKEKSL